MMRFRWVLLCLLPLLLNACARQEAAVYQVDEDNRHSLSVMRTIYPWDSRWEVKLVTAHMPQCQRRYDLKDVPESRFKIDLYQPEAKVFILNQGKNWYVTEMGKCQFQKFETPPPVPGTLIGEFVDKDEQFAFVDAAGKVSIMAPITR